MKKGDRIDHLPFMEKINWGIIGCGDVAEIKSGPAFQKVKNSTLLAVMRRNGGKARDFALRHNVPMWSDNADDLLHHKQINALYISTPPSTHLEYTLKALEAGKHVYLEKPMAIDSGEAKQICHAAEQSSCKLTVAHYRRKLPAFLKVRELLGRGAIGNIIFADIQILLPGNSDIIADTEENWRLEPSISGGGYFYDLAPHQIDLMYHYFGKISNVRGFSTSATENPLVEDIVNGIIAFESGVQFRGLWNFGASPLNKKEECIIYGSRGRIHFSFYGESVTMYTPGGSDSFTFTNPTHVQQPMIETTVNYFLGKDENPCPASDGLVVMEVMEQLSNR